MNKLNKTIIRGAIHKPKKTTNTIAIPQIYMQLSILLFWGFIASCATINEGQQYAEILLDIKIKSAIFSSIALDDNDNMYFGTNNKGVFSLSSDGSTRWNYHPDEKIKFNSSPLLTDDGMVIIGASDGKVYALDKEDGSLQWNFLTGNRIFASPTTAYDGTIYIASTDYKLYALDAEGTMLWFVNTYGAILASPIVGQDGIIYVASEDMRLYAINPDGSIKWKYQIESGIYSSVAVSADNSTLYLGSEKGMLYAINTSTAQLRWKNSIGDRVYASIVLAENGNVYVCAHNNIIFAFDPQGKKLWSHRVPGEIVATPAIGNDGMLYIVSTRDDNNDGFFTILTSDASLIWQRKFSRDLRSSPVIGKDGRVYFGSNIGRVYVLKGKSSGPATHDWSMFRGDRTHKGQASKVIETIP